jgi:2-polyprenyl-3-methyl-5-hydroxy-6-metoxy-1,4-benzoquinol methylase
MDNADEITKPNSGRWLLPENIYGHVKRLDWANNYLRETDSIVEFGCGTGCMITLPLCQAGYDATGVDLDPVSVEYGKNVFAEEGVSPERIRNCDLKDLEFVPDVVFASEVLEHIPDEQLSGIAQIIKSKLSANGTLLVTVPNGYGWFEMESFLWFKAGLGFLIRVTGISRIVLTVKKWLLGDNLEAAHPSSLADSPHVQRFTYRSIQDFLKGEGFDVTEIRGSVLFAGPFSNLFFTGIKPLMSLNCWLGDKLPRLAAGFYCHCRPATVEAGNTKSRS